jgi:hypothetical protein
VGSLLTKVRCKLGRHKRLDVIQTFGAAQHIGCPDCGREMAIHHGMRACLPWDSEIEQLYRDMGYDTAAPHRRWKHLRGHLHAGRTALTQEPDNAD